MKTPYELLRDACDAPIVEHIDLPPRSERRLPAPESYRTGAMGDWLTGMAGGSDTVWRHQALAMNAIRQGKNLVISTGTASGKTLPFQAAAIDVLLNGDGTTLVLCPQIALGGDQCARWRRALELAGRPPDLVAEINGNIGMATRDAALAQAAIVLATPDVLHAWLMRQVNAPLVRSFLERLRFVVIDEAHVLEGVFGSNSAYFFRRFRSAHARICAERGIANRLQFIAASATIDDACAHMKRLTGCDFVGIEEEENGAPFHGLTLLHVEGPDHGAAAERMAADIARALADYIAPDAFITFAESRMGVEHIARNVGREDVRPYRGGYDPRHRREIEAQLRCGELRGIISTSALELGIDIPQFTIGMNVGIPDTVKALRQRIGRIGRSKPGLFVVVAPAASFLQLGGSLREFYERQAEPSHLYLGNPIIQFEAARCLIEESGCEDGTPVLPDNVEWPDGFQEMFAQAIPGAVRTPDLDQVAQLEGDTPHYAYSLRRICEVSYAVQNARDPDDSHGTINLDQALREAYPGATYLYMGRPHRVIDWRSNGYGRTILLRPAPDAPATRPILRAEVGVSLDRTELIERRLLIGDLGCLAETRMRVAESVEGYRIGSTAYLYRDLREKDRRMVRKRREYSTTGVLLRIGEPWFKGDGEHQIAARRTVARALHALLAREHSVSPGEIRAAHSGIALHRSGGRSPIDDAIVLFDTVSGGIRLTAPLFDEMSALIERFRRAAEMAGTDALIDVDTVARLAEWHISLVPREAAAVGTPLAGNDELLIYAPQSEVSVRIHGELVERTLIEPQLMSLEEGERLLYRYESSPGVTGWVAHDRIVPAGNNWRQVLWNPRSNTMREIAA